MADDAPVNRASNVPRKTRRRPLAASAPDTAAPDTTAPTSAVLTGIPASADRTGGVAGDVGGVRVRDLFRTPDRFLRSVHVERDFADAEAVRQYVVTPPIADALARVVDGLRPVSGRRAWRVTGDYGSGKSSFALAVAHLLRDPAAPALAHVRQAVDLRGLGPGGGPRLTPVLVTGGREGIVGAVARGVSRTVAEFQRGVRAGGARGLRALAALGDDAESVARGGDAGALLELLGRLTAFVVGSGGTGVLLVVDELGKLLEFAALHPEREDVYVLQRLADAAARSGEHPLVFLGLLHQGFHAYAERLPAASRHEWEKVAGRFDEIVFDQPLAHTAALIAGALGVRPDAVPGPLNDAAPAVAAEARASGWFGGRLSAERVDPTPNGAPAESTRRAAHAWDDPLRVYPLHPTVLPVLVRFFARYGQHERSLFSFLLSSEPFGLQAFADRLAGPDAWYRLADFYDYVRATFGHRLAGASYRSQWLRISGVLDAVGDVGATQLAVLKTVAVLNVLDAEHLLPTDAALTAAVADGADAVAAAVAALRARGVLFDRGPAGGYRLWPNTSVNLESAYAAATAALGAPEQVSPHLAPYIDTSPLVARRHYVETGTLRHFEVRYAAVAALRATALRPTDADGVVVVALSDTTPEALEAEGFASSDALAERPDVIVAVPGPLAGLAPELQEARCWAWVAANTPELAHDAYAGAEVARQVAASRRALVRRLAAFIGFRDGAPTDPPVTWLRAREPLTVPPGRGLLAVLSEVCDTLYAQAPKLRNEILNRRLPSSQAVAARSRLIERMLRTPELPALGLAADKAPPERSMYLSVLERGRVHQSAGSPYRIALPPADADPLRLRPALERILQLLDAAEGDRVPVAALFRALQARPFGVRAGAAPLLLAVVAAAHRHELAWYEGGTFRPRFGPDDFVRLVKVPTAFEVQLCRVTGVRADVFERLAAVFASPSSRSGGGGAAAVGETGEDRRGAELLDVVTPLCTTAAQLPDYTRRATALPEAAARVRDALLSAREPATLLFHDLPIACGAEPFASDVPGDAARVQAFVAALRGALDDLRTAYPGLLDRVTRRAIGAVGEPGAERDAPTNWARLRERAGRVAFAAREPRLRGFALRLADAGLKGDAWTEALGSYVLGRPPARWVGTDEARFGEELDRMATTFQRVDAITFDARADAPGVRVALTWGDGAESERVVHVRPDDEAAVTKAVAALGPLLPDAPDLRVAALSRLLWASLHPDDGPGRQPLAPHVQQTCGVPGRDVPSAPARTNTDIVAEPHR